MDPTQKGQAVLIIGAGPVGLAAALFLTRRGIAVRVLDADAAPHSTSRALAVSPRTLTLLKDSGVTDAMLAEGNSVGGMQLLYRGKPLTRIAPDWARIGTPYPMLILPQARSEALMIEALSALGVRVERGRTLTSLSQTETTVTAAFADGERINGPLLFAADGAHSTARHALDIAYPGDSNPEPWHLMDVDLDGPPPHDGFIDFGSGSAFVCLPYSGNRYRLFAFGRALPDSIPSDWRVGAVHWQSEFTVSHRIAERLSVGRIALGGDAAHIHSPIGGRGMNLGIEDAWVFSACAADFLNGETGRLADYNRLRHPADAAVVRAIRAITRFVTDGGFIADVLKRTAPPIATRFPGLINRALRIGMGLDHPVRLR